MPVCFALFSGSACMLVIASGILVVQGPLNKQIASELDVSEITVKVR